MTNTTSDCADADGATSGPAESEVARRFTKLAAYDPQGATAYLYRKSCETGYIDPRTMQRDIRWTSSTSWGPLEITINLSKPEKDPRDIAKAAKAERACGSAGRMDEGAHPACQLCVDSEDYERCQTDTSETTHSAQHGTRVMAPLALGGQRWWLFYSPFAYFTEHCIAVDEHHVPMHIDHGTFERLLDFVDLLPHYFIGSNADLPLVGGSILAHDHFQGGCYIFPMDRAAVDMPIALSGFPDVEAGIVHWPMTVLRLRSENRHRLADAAEHILRVWSDYSDKRVGIIARSEGVRHNTITPIVRKVGETYTMSLALRCNVTTDEYPLGVFHPHGELHHIKKENIGLIEVMGLAILPPRLERELSAVCAALLDGADLEGNPLTASHASWASGAVARHPELCKSNVSTILQDEVGLAFAQVLEQSGVFKWDDEGRAALERFLNEL